jgi:hypothetical protein
MVLPKLKGFNYSSTMMVWALDRAPPLNKLSNINMLICCITNFLTSCFGYQSSQIEGQIGQGVCLRSVKDKSWENCCFEILKDGKRKLSAYDSNWVRKY